MSTDRSDRNFYSFKGLFFDACVFSFLFAVVGYFLARPSEEQLLNLSLLLKLFLILFTLGMALSFVLNHFALSTWGEKIFSSSSRFAQKPAAKSYESFWKWQAVVTLLCASVVGILITELSLENIFDRDGFSGAMRIFQELFHPNFEILPRAILRMVETIFMAFLATAFAIPFAFIFSFLAAKNIMTHPLAYVFYILLRTVLNAIRSVEAFMWAIIFSVWVGIGPAAGLLALMLHSIASLAKQYSEIVESVNEGPIEGIKACGANQIQVIWFAIVPQVILPYVSFTIYRWDINVRMATIVGFVGGGGIGKLLIAYQGQAQWKEVGCIFLVIAIVVWILDQASAYLREALK